MKIKKHLKPYGSGSIGNIVVGSAVAGITATKMVHVTYGKMPDVASFVTSTVTGIAAGAATTVALDAIDLKLEGLRLKNAQLRKELDSED